MTISKEHTEELEQEEENKMSEEMKYYIWICKKCKKQLSEEFMGNVCKCGEWTECKKRVILK